MYSYGMYLGRFQPFHVGHRAIMKKMMEECHVVIICLGSSQEERTARNPLTNEERISMIIGAMPELIGKAVFVKIPDREDKGNDSSWGEYVFKLIKDWCGYTPEVVYEGEEEERVSWWESLGVEVKKISREDIPISATLIRKLWKDGEDKVASLMVGGIYNYSIFDKAMKEIYN